MSDQKLVCKNHPLPTNNTRRINSNIHCIRCGASDDYELALQAALDYAENPPRDLIRKVGADGASWFEERFDNSKSSMPSFILISYRD